MDKAGLSRITAGFKQLMENQKPVEKGKKTYAQAAAGANASEDDNTKTSEDNTANASKDNNANASEDNSASANEDTVTNASEGKKRHKSFSDMQSNRIVQLKKQLAVAKAGLKSIFHKDRADVDHSLGYSAQEGQGVAPETEHALGAASIPTRPWTSHPDAGTSMGIHRSGTDPQRASEPPLVPQDLAQGAAARQSAREHGRLSITGDPSVRHDSSTEIHRIHSSRDRESGISLGMDGLSISNPSRSHTGPATPRLNPTEHLPWEVVQQILSHLDLKQLLRISRVSRQWLKASSDPLLRKRVFLLKWSDQKSVNALPAPVGGLGLGRTDTLDQDWAAMYRARQELEERWRRGPFVSEVRATYLNGHQDSVYCVQFDEEIVVTGSRDRTIRVWDIHTGRLQKVIGIPEALEADHSRTSIAGTQSALLGPMHVSNNPPRLHDSHIYHTPSYFHNASILCLQFDKNTLVTGSSDTLLIVWDMCTWQPQRILKGHTAGVLDIAFDEHKIISCSKDGTILIWDRLMGDLLGKIQGHRGPVNAVQLRGNMIVSASGEGCAKIWQLEHTMPGTEGAACSWRSVRDFWSKDKGLACVEFSVDGSFVWAGGNDHVVYKYSTATGELLEALEGHTHLVRSLYLDSMNRRVISGSYDLNLRCWDAKEDRQLWCLQRWSSSWILSAKSDYRRLLSTSQDGRALLIDFGVGVPGVELLGA